MSEIVKKIDDILEGFFNLGIVLILFSSPIVVLYFNDFNNLSIMLGIYCFIYGIRLSARIMNIKLNNFFK